MIIIIYLGYNYISEPQKFKLYALPLVVGSYLGVKGYYKYLDFRINIFIYIVAALSTIYYVINFRKAYKVERYQAIVRARDEEGKALKNQGDRPNAKALEDPKDKETSYED